MASPNRLELQASLAEMGVLRFTPAGIPARDLVLEHESTADEAGASRSVKLVARAVAFGTVAERLAQAALGSRLALIGFIAAARGGKQLVVHIQDFQIL